MAEKYNFSRFNVLIADSNRHMRQVVSEVLRSFGFGNILDVGDAATALMELRTVPVDLIIVDWMLEPLDGREFTKVVRTASDSTNPFVPIIMITGHTERFRVIGARDVGVTEFLAKPVSPKTLFRRIASVVDNPRPFIRGAGYFGPDRRRHDSTLFDGLKRRAIDQPADPASSTLTPEEVAALFQVS